MGGTIKNLLNEGHSIEISVDGIVQLYGIICYESR